MSLVSIKWRPDGKALRKFGAVVIIGLCLIGFIFHFWIGNTKAAYGLYLAAAILGLPALSGTRIALPGYWLWMGIAFAMGNVTGRALLSIFYYGMITPMGLVRRMTVDRLALRKRDQSTYWKDLTPDDPTRYERQF